MGLVAALAAASLVLALLTAAPALGAYGGPASGPHPVQCAPAPCHSSKSPPFQILQVSTIVQLTVTPHVVHVGEELHMHRTGYCDPNDGTGATCFGAFSLGGPNGDGPTGVHECPGENSNVNMVATSSADFCLVGDADTEGWQTVAARGTPSSNGQSCITPSDCIYDTANYYMVNNSLYELSGTVKPAVGKPTNGLTVRATGPGGDHDTKTDKNGHYVFALDAGTYTVKVVGRSTLPQSRSVELNQNRAGIDFDQPHDQVSIAVDPAVIQASGRGLVTVTITDKNSEDQPVPDQEIQIEPPVTYDVPALVCDPNRNLVSPIRLPSSHELIGAHFNRFTDNNGQVRFTMFVGAVPGDIIIEAGEPDQPRAEWDSKVLTVSPPGGGGQLPNELPALLQSQGTSDLAAGGEFTLLRWLGTIKNEGALGGIGFMPIHAHDETVNHRLHEGVVLFAENQGVKQQLFSYLDGKTDTPPDVQQAQVIDVDNLFNWEFGQLVAGHVGHSLQDHLQSVAGWRDGENVQFGEKAHTFIPGRGRPFAGFGQSPGANSDLLYEYGPYPPFGADQQTTNTFDHCVSPGFQGTTIFVHSPLSVVVSDSHGHKVGVSAKGKPTDKLAGAVLSYKGKLVKSIFLPNGSYKVAITGTGSGPATLVIASGKKTDVFSFQVTKGEKGTLKVKSGHLPKTLHFGGRKIVAAGGIALSVKGLPKTLKRGKTTTLKLTVRDQFGAIARGVALKLKGPAGANGIEAVSDHKGQIKLPVHPAKAGKVTATFSGLGYLQLKRKLSVP